MRKLMALPDQVRVFPAHGAGSACGKNLSTERRSTIGEQRVTNYACRPMTEDEFLAIVTAGQPSAPDYFVHDALLNRREHPVFDPAAAPVPLDLAEVLERQAAGAVVLDARDPQEFAAGHLAGSVNVPADGRFAETAGSVVRPDGELVVVVPQDREEEVVVRLARIGFDRVAGYLREPEGAFLEAPDRVVPASRLTVGRLDEALRREVPPAVVDVRNRGELITGTIPGAVNIPLAELPRRMDEVPTDRPVVVHCAGGYRSSVAASLLRTAGHTDVSDLLGGFTAWAAADRQPA
ncbi:rhodanese-like domain-containing protein [Geodermatophilus sp. SYSU D00758]